MDGVADDSSPPSSCSPDPDPPTAQSHPLFFNASKNTGKCNLKIDFYLFILTNVVFAVISVAICCSCCRIMGGGHRSSFVFWWCWWCSVLFFLLLFWRRTTHFLVVPAFYLTADLLRFRASGHFHYFNHLSSVWLLGPIADWLVMQKRKRLTDDLMTDDWWLMTMLTYWWLQTCVQWTEKGWNSKCMPHPTSIYFSLKPNRSVDTDEHHAGIPSHLI